MAMPRSRMLSQDTTLASDVIDELAALNPNALIPDGFEDAVIGIERRDEEGLVPIARISVNMCINILKKDMSEEEAIEFFNFNVGGSWHGENTPLYTIVDTPDGVLGVSGTRSCE
jgi:hypothetical protein